MESNIINEIEGNNSLCSKKANIYKIFMNIKKMFNNDNKETKSKLYFFINLLLSRRDIDNSFKIILYSMLSYLNFSDHHYTRLLSIGNKVHKIHLKENKRHNSKYTFDIYWRVGEMSLKKKNFFESFRFYEYIKDQENYTTQIKDIREIIQFQLSKIQTELNNKEIVQNIITKCLGMFGNDSVRNEKMYMISFLWSKQLFQFVNLCNQAMSNITELKIDDFFDPIKIFECYINTNSRNSERVAFPYLINNQCIIDEKDIWYDPEDNNNTNIVLQKGMKENENYFLINEDNYSFLEKLFNKDFTIVRYGTFNQEKKTYEYEIYLQKLKILVLDNDFVDKGRGDLIKFRYIQYSIKTTFKEFKEKIKRCVEHEFKEDNKLAIDIKNIKMYIIPRKLMFDTLFCYYHKIKFEINNAKQITLEDDSTLEVSLLSDKYSLYKIQEILLFSFQLIMRVIDYSV